LVRYHRNKQKSTIVAFSSGIKVILAAQSNRLACYCSNVEVLENIQSQV